MAAARKQRSADELIAEAARRALSDADGDLRRATNMFEQAVRASGSLRTALTEPLIASACYDAIRKQMANVRREVWTGSKAKRPIVPVAGQSQADRVVHLAAGTLAMFPLPGGKRLGDATRAEIAAAAEFYSRQSKDMGAKARWLTLVGQSIPDGKTVSDVLSDARLRELQVEATRNAS